MATKARKQAIAKFRARQWRKWAKLHRRRTLRERRGGILLWLRQIFRLPARTT